MKKTSFGRPLFVLLASGVYGGVPVQVMPVTLTFNSDDAWTGGVAEDGDGGSIDIINMMIQVMNVTDTTGTDLGSISLEGHDFLSSEDTAYSGLTYGENAGSKGMSIRSGDGAEFQINQFQYYNWGETVSTTNTVKGYRDGSEVASMTFEAYDPDFMPLTVSLDGNFDNVDDVIIYISAGGYLEDQSATNHSINNIVFDRAAVLKPVVTDGNISISGASGMDGSYQIGDTVTAIWNNTADGDNNTGITGVLMDFSQFGGDTAVTASDSGGNWTATHTITSGAIAAVDRNVSVIATNTNGATTTADTTNATVNAAFVFTSPATASAAENQTIAYIATATAPEGGEAPTFSIVGGTDAALFAIDSATGVLTFKVAPDFEAPVDAGADNVYDVTLRADAEVATADLDLAITVTNANDAPTLALNDAVLAYTEGGSAIQIDAAGILGDSDGDAQWNQGTLTVQITANSENSDEISLVDSDDDAPALTIAGTTLLADELDIGDVNVAGGVITGATVLEISFNHRTTNAHVEEVLRSLRYRNTSLAPGMLERIITVTATDRRGAATTATRTVSVARSPGVPGQDPGQDKVIDTFTPNTGTITNPVITAEGTIEGGTLAGHIDNAGMVRNVLLANGAELDGGSLSGTITGSASRPALLSNATILPGTVLQNVVIGAGTVLQPGVQLGQNVKFQNAASIPAGLDLTPALRNLDWSDGDLRGVVDLGDDVLEPADGSAPMTLIRSIQLLTDYEPAGSLIEQGFNGEILVLAEDFSSALLPVKVNMAAPDEEPGTYINEDGDVVFVTVSHRVVLAYPALRDKPGFTALLEALGLALGYDERANMIAMPADQVIVADVHVVGGVASQALLEGLEFYFSARPAVLALPAGTDAEVGVQYGMVPGLPNATQVSVVFQDENGNLLMQDVVPVPADWLLLKASLQALPGMSEVRIDTHGVISVLLNGAQMKGRSGFRVTPDSRHLAAAERVAFVPAGDINGDGRHDFMMIYPNGDRQPLYIYPVQNPIQD